MVLPDLVAELARLDRMARARIAALVLPKCLDCIVAVRVVGLFSAVFQRRTVLGTALLDADVCVVVALCPRSAGAGSHANGEHRAGIWACGTDARIEC